MGTAFLAALSISWWARGIATPSAGERPAPPTPDGVVGFPHKVDAVATLEAAQELTKRVDLRGLQTFGVSRDGLLDMAAPGRFITYTFTSARGQGPQPPRPPGTLPRRDLCGKQIIRVNGSGIYAEPDLPGLPCTQSAAPLPNPRCGPKQVWEAAVRHGMPADQLANIQYFRAMGGPAWRFELPSLRRSLVLYGDCERELTGAEAADASP